METEFIRQGGAGLVRLNRPHVLNALGPEQFPAIHRQLAEWAEDDGIGVIVFEGVGERAFCAGGDLKAVWDGWRRGDHAGNRALFRSEYALDRAIHRYDKPIVALLDGMVMGGGAGLSVNGRFQVATERTVFAMPEAAIGFFPDVGGTHFLSRCPGQVGLYLGLTGARLGAADMLWAGLATHHVPAARIDALRDALAVAGSSRDPAAAVAEVLAARHVSPGAPHLPERLELINRCFGRATLAEVVDALSRRAEPWLVAARQSMAVASPTSLAVIFRQLTEGRGLEFEAAIAREYRMACAFLDGREFREGIRAVVMDKDRNPRWSPDNVASVTAAEVERHFAAIADELVFDGEGDKDVGP